MPNTTRTQIPAEVNNFYDKNLLTRVVANFPHRMFAQNRPIPRNSGTSTIKFRRYSNLTAATTPLSEGITPVSSQLSVTDITATAAQYGAYICYTDVVDYESPDPTLTEYSDILGDQGADTLDQLTRDILVAGTSVYYGGTATSRGALISTDLMTTALIRKAVKLLKNNKAKRITKMIDASTGIATVPVDASFVAFVHPNVTATLKTLTEFVSIEKYASTITRYPFEVGKVDEVRFIESPNCKVFTGAGTGPIDVYATLILGENAYGMTMITGEGMKQIVKPFGSGGTSDPMDQRATIAWKSTFVAMILNNDFMVRLETAGS